MKIQKILVSQSAPSSFEKSPLNEIASKNHFEIVFRPFTIVEKVSLKEFRSCRVDFLECNAIIFTSRHAVDNFFNLASEARVTIPDDMKYFCTTEIIALYLQKYIVYRKRKIFFGNGTFSDLVSIIAKHKELKFIFPYTDKPKAEFCLLLKNSGINFKDAIISKTIQQDLSDIDLKSFGLIVVYTSKDIKVLDEYAKNEKDKLMVAASGRGCAKVAFESGYKVVLWAPNQIFPSMVGAIDQYSQDMAKNNPVDKYELKSLDQLPTQTKIIK